MLTIVINIDSAKILRKVKKLSYLTFITLILVSKGV